MFSVLRNAGLKLNPTTDVKKERKVEERRKYERNKDRRKKKEIEQNI